MKPTVALCSLVLGASFLGAPLAVGAQEIDPHGWLGTETLQTRFGDFQFEGGYPAGDAADRLFEIQTLSRAIEVYQNQLMRVSEAALDEGLRAFGATKPTQVVIWENLMDAATVLLTANTETVYAIAHLDLKADGPTVVDAPPHMLGAMQDSLQRWLADVGPLGADKGEGGKFLVLPPGYEGSVPDGYFVVRSPTYGVTFFLRGFQQDGSTDAAVALMKADQGLSAGRSVFPAADGVPQRVEAGHPDGLSRQLPLLRAAGRAGGARAERGLRAARAGADAGDRHREGQAFRAGREDEGRCSPRRPGSAAPSPAP